MKGKTILFWFGVIFTISVPIIIGIKYQDSSTAWIAALCGAFVTFMSRINDIAELSLGPLRAKMRETIKEAYATIDQLRNVATRTAKAQLTDLMAGEFMAGMSTKTRLELHDQILNSLQDIGASEEAIKEATSMWDKGIGVIYHRIIRHAIEGRTDPHTINTNASPEVRSASDDFHKLLVLDEWKAATPDEMEQFIATRGVSNDTVAQWLEDYRHFCNTGEIPRRELFEQQ